MAPRKEKGTKGKKKLRGEYKDSTKRVQSLHYRDNPCNRPLVHFEIEKLLGRGSREVELIGFSVQ